MMFEHIFKDLFPIFVYYSYLKRCLGSRRMEQISDGGHWNSCFSRNLHDWESNHVETFFLRLQGKLMRRNVERATQMAMSEVAFQLNPSILGWYKERLEYFCGDVIWNSWAPTKVSFFFV